MTDGQTDRQTMHDRIGRACMGWRGKNRKTGRVIVPAASRKKQVERERLLRTRSTFSKSLLLSVEKTDLTVVNSRVKINGAYYQTKVDDVGELKQRMLDVSLTSQVSKIYESILRDAIMEHLVKNQLLRDSQHGFLRGRSCLSNLLTFLDKVTVVSIKVLMWMLYFWIWQRRSIKFRTLD